MKHVIASLILICCYAFMPFPPDKAVVEVLRGQVLAEAAWALQQAPVTVTSEVCVRSVGGKHDFYSEGDYWWPVPGYPDSPYVQKDGLTNPANFTAHRSAMIRFSRIVGALASAYRITGDTQYVHAAQRHLQAWFTDTATLMHPNLLYAQAIKGRFTGRGIGIIDTIHLMEVAQGVLVMQYDATFDRTLLDGVKKWFREYLHWLTTHQYGKDEMNAKNNHGTCWVMQVAAFARLTRDSALLQFCRNRYREVLLPNQMAADGSFPLELARTKPYGYSLFNLDAMVTICQILSDGDNNLWTFQLPDGRSIHKGIAYLYPYVAGKNHWPLKPDVMYWNEWPVAHPFLVFGALTFQRQDWFNTWKGLEHQPDHPEVVRNLPVRHPLIWL
ncbi:alginate lyase family protein [Chitinophaga rhizophila]|uniref:Alginate lyase family protein n=1 Tax=Chitinophaga rhizophila TaxID=2866212 RepID=A0ABS7GKG0_9BACT|nr:alginate lyase family protein [Chitinophaga rhizophila]MBW8688208.1 alginate lyase family protein [Chitinophaga rhizophila]